MCYCLKQVAVIALMGILQWSCQSPTDALESKLKPLFFQADQKSDYDQLVAYYGKHKLLKQLKGGGWTMYPPLSALPQSENDDTRTIFKFHQYQDFQGLKEGTLTVRKKGNLKNAEAVAEIVLTFNSAKDAETAHNTLLQSFADFQKTETPLSAMMKSTIVYDKNDKPAISISALYDTDHSHYTVSIYQLTDLRAN